MKLENPQLSWEAFKYLSKNVLTEKELDIYYFLINQYIEKEGFENLFPLLEQADEENLTLDEATIRSYINSIC